MNLNLLIVDDEPEILAWLEELFRYDYERIIEVYTAGSAREALDLLNRIRFDVVLTDIRMPGMDGIVLYEKIKANWPKCKTVFLTGYQNFDDIYRLTKDKDVKYVLKSEDDEVILEAVDKSFEQVCKEVEGELDQHHIERARYLIQRETFEKALRAKLNREEIQKQFYKEKIKLNIDIPMLAALLRVERADSGQMEQKVEMIEQLGSTLEENLPANIGCYFYGIDRRYALLLIQPEIADGNWARLLAVAQGALEYTQEHVRNNGKKAFSAVISSTKLSFDELPHKEIWLRRIMVSCLGEKEQAVIHAEIVMTAERLQGENEAEVRAGMLKAYLELRQKREYYELLNSCCRRLTSYRSIHDTKALELYYSMAVTLLQFINETHVNEELAFRIGLYRLMNFQEHESWQEAEKYLYDLSEALFDLLGVSDNTLTDRALERLNSYIDTHLSGDLSLCRLAEVGGFNASYLSRLFKKVYRVTLSDYILKKRMELAKELLVNTNRKIQEISVKAGYLSGHSFARTFRNYEGLSPIEYRELHAYAEKES